MQSTSEFNRILYNERFKLADGNKIEMTKRKLFIVVVVDDCCWEKTAINAKTISRKQATILKIKKFTKPINSDFGRNE